MIPKTVKYNVESVANLRSLPKSLYVNIKQQAKHGIVPISKNLFLRILMKSICLKCPYTDFFLVNIIE